MAVAAELRGEPSDTGRLKALNKLMSNLGL